MASQRGPDDHIFDPVERMSRDELKSLQLERLRGAVEHAKRVPHYAKALAGFDVGAIRSLDDVRRLPVTTKQDLSAGYPLDFNAIPRHEIARIHVSSGTTGKMTFVPYSKKDMETWVNVVARFLMAGGLRPGMLMQISFDCGLFTGGFGLHHGAEKIGAAVIPIAGGNIERQIMIIRDLAPDALVCVSDSLRAGFYHDFLRPGGIHRLGL